ncbi:UNVERIFIED_CONTAM: hypothetical protein K2H54_012077 [Gekko kuhli]
MAAARGVRCCQQAAAEGSLARAAVPSSREKEDESNTTTAARGVRCCQQAAAEGSPARAAASSSREKVEDESSTAAAHGVSPIRHRQQLQDAWPGRRRCPPPGHLKVESACMCQKAGDECRILELECQ